MLKTEARFWENVMFLVDCLVLGLAWLVAWELRFVLEWPLPVVGEFPARAEYARLLLFVPPTWAVLYRVLGLYRPRRIDSRTREWLHVLVATSFAAVTLLAAGWLFYKLQLSRAFLGIFWVASALGLNLTRVLFREVLRFFRRRGYNLRHAVVVGSDSTARSVPELLHRHPELGIRLSGYVLLSPEEGDGPSEDGSHENTVEGFPVLGDVDELPEIVRRQGLRQVFLSITPELQPRLDGLLADLEEEMAHVSIVSDLLRESLLRGRLELFEGLPLISMSGTPVIGWNRVLKRSFDFWGALVLVLLLSPLLALLAVVTALTSGRPIFYRQIRMGLDGRRFGLMKFRTMRVDAESGGAVWSRQDDPRRTRLGSLLRRLSLDELPQLWNVLKGEMSLVGPRPERPVFVDEFKASIPRYMVRHRVKAGLTGWAQIHGLRGATSVPERLRYDLFYIENWSLLLDLKILWRTLWGGFLDRSA